VKSGTDPSTVKPEPVPNPYHRFEFSPDFRVAPPPTAPYIPSSGALFSQFEPIQDLSARIDLDPLRDNSCFRFDFHGISLGCNSTDQPCLFEIVSIQWDGKTDVVQGTQTLTVEACPQQANCSLSAQTVEASAAASFTNLTAINITATSADEPVTFWADDLQLSWTNNTCGAATCRSKVPNTIMKQSSLSSTVSKTKGFLRWAGRVHV
jgi:hypothetical protein